MLARAVTENGVYLAPFENFVHEERRNFIRRETNISYLVCHMEKYHKTDISPVEKENERDENYEASNPQIDRERTKDNYHTFARYCSYTEFINKRIDELNLSTKPRKDAVLMASFVIGSDGEFFKTAKETVNNKLKKILLNDLSDKVYSGGDSE